MLQKSDRTTSRAKIDPRKRLFDFILAMAIAPLALLVCLLVSVLIIVFDRAPPLFRQTRVGRHRRPFKLFKLRTMRLSSPDLPTHEASIQLVTPLGRFCRLTKIDELPQLLNVLNGTMSLVGPRPCLPSQHELIELREKAGVYELLPGVTGPSQLAGIDMSTPAKLAQADAGYDRRWSLARDLRILFATFTGSGTGDAMAIPREAIDNDQEINR